MSNDGQRLAEMIMYVGSIIGTPVMIVIATVFSCVFLGWTAIIGIITFLSFIPIQVTMYNTEKPVSRLFVELFKCGFLIE